MTDAPSLINALGKFVNDKVEKRSLGNAKMEQRFNKLAAAVDEEKIRGEDRITKKDGPGTIAKPSLLGYIWRQNTSLYTYSTSTSSHKLESCYYQSRHWEGRSGGHWNTRKTFCTISSTYMRGYSDFMLKILLLVSKKYQKAADNHYHYPVHKPERCNDAGELEVWNMRMKVAVQMTN